MATLSIGFSDNADPNQASVGSTMTIDLTGLVVTNEVADLTQLASLMAQSDIFRRTVGGAQNVHINSLVINGETRQIYPL